MTALNMKLESKELLLGLTERGNEANGCKCSKNAGRKVNPLNDKDALKIRNGLGYESGPAVNLDNSKLSTLSEAVCMKKRRGRKVNINGDGKMLTKSDKIQESLQQSLSEDSKKKISTILNEIRLLSDVEKLFLYLQLPTGSPLEADPLKQKCQGNPLGKKADEEGTLAITWIQSHLEEDPDVSLPKQEVYDEYQSYCDVTSNEPLCAADFGKVMKQIFPSVKPRRLGTRGNSRYCYSGLRKKFKVQAPSLPDLQMEKENCKNEGVNKVDDEVTTAACHLLFEWTEKLLGIKFISLRELASHLIENMYVDNRSVAAFTVLLSTTTQQFHKGSSSGNLRFENGCRKSETQIHLQRKLQEKELIKEQKRKLQEQRSLLATMNEGKPFLSRKKGSKNKRSRVPSTSADNMKKKDKEAVSEVLRNTDEEFLPVDEETDNKGAEEQGLNMVMQNEVNLSAEVCLKDSANGQSSHLVGQVSSSYSPNTKVGIQQSSGSISDTEECIKKKKSTKLPITRNKTPVCITQSLPSIIIVPSLPQVQITELGTRPATKTPKYKRIQPKPLSDSIVTSAIRSRAGSVGSALLSENRHQSIEGRRSSHAWLQSDVNGSQEYFEESISITQVNKNHTSFPNDTNASVFKKLSPIKHETSELECTSEKLPSDIRSSILNSLPSVKIETADSDSTTKTVVQATEDQNFKVESVTEINNDQRVRHISNSQQRMFKEAQELIEDGGAVKRHSEELDGQVVSKKPHLEELLTSEISSDSLSPWTKDVCNMNCDLPSVLMQNPCNSTERTNAMDDQGVSIHQLENDALNEFLHGNSAESASSDLTNSPGAVSETGTSVVNVLQQKMQENCKISGSKNDHQSYSKVNQLSQLRMLLEKNLPHTVTKVGSLNSTRLQKEAFVSDKPPVAIRTNVLPSQSKHSEMFDTSEHDTVSSMGELHNALLQNNKIYLNNKNEVVSSLVSAHWQRLKSISSISQMDLPGMESTLSNTDDLSPQDIILSEQDLLSVISESGGLANLPKDDTHMMSFNSDVNKIQSTPLPVISDAELSAQQICNVMSVGRSSTQTQVPSVPPSPNTRRRAFNFMPISPRHTPIPEGMTASGTPASYSPVPVHLAGARNMVSVAVGPSQPPSAASSPFVSPRSTPVPLSRSRHSSGQSSYSTSRHTPFQNFDSGVSSISTSPFISPQPTPVPLSRLRHNSSHGPSKTVTFSTVNNPQVIHTQSPLTGHGSSRSRHSSGPGGPHLAGPLLSPRSAPLSPLVGETCTQTSFTFPATGEPRSRHNSGSNITPLSPVSEQISPSSSCTSNQLSETASGNLIAEVTAYLNINAGEEMDGLNASKFGDVGCRIHNSEQPSYLKQPRQRHSSSSVILGKTATLLSDPLSHEVQLLLKNGPSALTSSSANNTRSRSVPLHQMLRNLENYCVTPITSEDTIFSKSHPTTPVTNQTFSFPLLGSSQVTASLNTITLTGESLNQNRDKTLTHPQHSEWANIDDTSEMENTSVRRNLANFLEQPLEDDLQTTLEDLRDCDNDFSKFAQELEEMGQNEEAGL